jgi:hypothetical protein
MEKKTNELTYSYIWNNQVVKTKDKEYQSRLESFAFRYENDVTNNINMINLFIITIF